MSQIGSLVYKILIINNEIIPFRIKKLLTLDTFARIFDVCLRSDFPFSEIFVQRKIRKTLMKQVLVQYLISTVQMCKTL